MVNTNAYARVGTDSVAELKQKIVDDLSPLGDVEVTGFITPIRNSFLMDGVVANITPKSMGKSFEYAVTWSDEDSAPAYSCGGRTVDPPLREYDATEEDEVVVDPVVEKTMERLARTVPAQANTLIRTRWQNAHRTPLVIAVAVALVLGVNAWAVLAAPEWHWMIRLIMHLVVSFGTFVIIGNVLDALLEKFYEKKLQKVTSEWESGRSKMFYGLFDTVEDQAVFIEHLIGLCEKKGLTFAGQPKVRYDAANQYAEVSPLSAPVVEFCVQSKYHNEALVVFNGQNLFHYTIHRGGGGGSDMASLKLL